ncbi:hypothetical protein [Sediminibacter sp. Hel_I_10]|uniref:hypothetical protein n=1 Tax=Sediminibacter sp. Hel_I_10 TaxID=1392490 RepID=UPI00047D456B|nr:hypothetical protein [Sediminibacter sp. Hel_I_10]
MKISALTLLKLTTLVLITVVIFAVMNIWFGWIFFATCAGQILFIYTVYRILTDDYKTDKTFRDFYEDKNDLGS